MSKKPSSANGNSPGGGRNYSQPFDTATRTYRVLQPKEGLPGVGTTFTATPWGDFFWRSVGLAKSVTDTKEIADLLEAKFIEQIGGPSLTSAKPVEATTKA